MSKLKVVSHVQENGKNIITVQKSTIFGKSYKQYIESGYAYIDAVGEWMWYEYPTFVEISYLAKVRGVLDRYKRKLMFEKS